MTFQQELASWNPFAKSQYGKKAVPEVGSQAPSTPQLKLPTEANKPTITAFLRHCGCPFAEKVFQKLREAAEQNPDIHCIATSHSDKASTEKWLQDIGGAGRLQIIVDDQRQTFSEYGLGTSSFWAVLNPSSMSAAMNLGKEEGINVRSTESGSRWQEAGLFATDSDGKLTYSHRAQTSDDLGDLEAALKSVKTA